MKPTCIYIGTRFQQTTMSDLGCIITEWDFAAQAFETRKFDKNGNSPEMPCYDQDWEQAKETHRRMVEFAMNTPETAEIAGPWTTFYPCSENCGFVGNRNAFSSGICYEPCPRCGAKREPRTGRSFYRLVTPFKFLPFIKSREFVRFEWRDELSKS